MTDRFDKYPIRAKELMDSAFMCIGEICFHIYKDSETVYIKATNLYGYRELLCKLTIIGGYSKKVSYDDMRIDFVSTTMSETKKYYAMWLLERNRDFFFDEYISNKELH